MVDQKDATEYNVQVLGKCHICGWTAPIKWCPKCEHWFCSSCRKAYFRRGLAAVKELVKGPTPGCCGPKE